MRLDVDEARRRFTASRVARLATVTPDGRPHIVPIVFALDDDVVYSAVDSKPKSTVTLSRLSNVDANPNVSLLVDHYDDDWQQLWWVRVDCTATVVDAAIARRGVELLTQRYSQYRLEPPSGPVLVMAPYAWSGWSFRDDLSTT